MSFSYAPTDGKLSTSQAIINSFWKMYTYTPTTEIFLAVSEKITKGSKQEIWRKTEIRTIKQHADTAGSKSVVIKLECVCLNDMSVPLKYNWRRDIWRLYCYMCTTARQTLIKHQLVGAQMGRTTISLRAAGNTLQTGTEAMHDQYKTHHTLALLLCAHNSNQIRKE